ADFHHEVFTEALAYLDLMPKHEDYLAARGLPRQEAWGRGYRSLTFSGRVRLTHHLLEKYRYVLHSLPGWVKTEKGTEMLGLHGLLAPVRDEQGRVLMLKCRQFHDLPRWAMLCGGGGPSMPALPHFPLGFDAAGGKVGVTEGEVKADSATVATGVP